MSRLRGRTALLRDHLAPLVGIAAAERVTTPEPYAFRMPPRRARVEQLRGYAVGIAEAARPFAQQFVQFGLPADFADRVVAAAQALIDAATQRRRQRTRGLEATRGLAEQLRRGRKTTQVLDAMVRSTTRGKPELFEAWRLAITPAATMVRSRPEVETVRMAEATPVTELVAPPTLASVEAPAQVQVQAKPRLLQLLRGPVRRRWAA